MAYGGAVLIHQIIERAPGGGWNYRAMQRKRYGWRQFLPEAWGFVDDFGDLCFAGDWRMEVLA